MDSVCLVNITEGCGIESTARNTAEAIRLDARNCKVPEVYSYSDDSWGYWLRCILLVTEL